MSKSCEQCSTEFFAKVPPSKFAKVKYCSRRCYYASRVGTNKVTKNCIICANVFEHWPYQLDAKCCSLICYQAYKKTDEYRTLLSQKHLGKVLSEETKQKISDVQKGKRTGEENNMWKGDDVKYRSLHEWIRRVKGTPDTCEHCGVKTNTGKRLVWANKSHNYLRDVDDWMRLCYPCHRKYDFPNEKHP